MNDKATRLRSRKREKRARSTEDYIRQIKKLAEDYEKCLGSLTKPVELFERLERAYRGVGFHDHDEEPCAVRSFIQTHPDHKGPIWIACPCRRCSVWC
jgi:hypothetical protein